MQRFLTTILLAVAALMLTATAATAQGQFQAATPAAWSMPAIIYPETWPKARYVSASADGTLLVALLPHTGSDDNSRHIAVIEWRNGVWQAPAVIAQNGAYSEAGFQVLPQRTHPVISGDGKTIAYVGYTGTTFGVYVVVRSAGGAWSAPALIDTGLANTHYWISLSRNGNALALSDYPFLGIQHLFVLTRTGGSWSGPVRVSHTSGPNQGGGMPSLSEDGSRLTFIANTHVMFSQRTLDGWSPPVALTADDGQVLMAEYPQLSGDGMAIHYWLVTLVPISGGAVRTAQDLYLRRWVSDRWSAPVRVTTVPVLPSSVVDGPATANRSATRLVYTRPVTTTDPGSDEPYISGSDLDVSEWLNDTWQTERLVEKNGFGNYNWWPRLAPVGRTLTFDGDMRAAGGAPVVNALWRMTTTLSPPVPPNALSLSTVLSMAGSSLFVPFDFVNYHFAPGTFTTTVTMTHTFVPNPPPPPPGQTGIGGIGGIGGLGGAFAATLLGPGGLPLQPLRPVTITVDYSGIDTGTTVPGSLNLWWRNDDQWVKLPGIDDPAAGAVMAPVSHFSHFAIFGETQWLYLPCVVR